MKTEQEILRICDGLLAKYINYDADKQNTNPEITIEDYTMLRTLIHILIDVTDEDKKRLENF